MIAGRRGDRSKGVHNEYEEEKNAYESESERVGTSAEKKHTERGPKQDYHS